MTLERLSCWRELIPVPSHGSTYVLYMIPPQNVMPARVTPVVVPENFTPVRNLATVSCTRASSETQGQSVGSGEKVGRKFSSTGERAPGYRLSPNYFQKFKQMCAPDCAQSANSFSWAPFVSSYTMAIVSITACLAHAPKKCAQSANFQCDIKSPSDLKILSARKLKTLFQKYKLELTSGIHACIGHASCVNTGEFLKDTTTADSHENVAWKSDFTFFQSLS